MISASWTGVTCTWRHSTKVLISNCTSTFLYLFCWANKSATYTASISVTTRLVSPSLITAHAYTFFPRWSLAIMPSPTFLQLSSEKELTLSLIFLCSGSCQGFCFSMIIFLPFSFCSFFWILLYSIHSSQALCATSLSVHLSVLKIHAFLVFQMCQKIYTVSSCLDWTSWLASAFASSLHQYLHDLVCVLNPSQSTGDNFHINLAFDSEKRGVQWF